MANRTGATSAATVWLVCSFHHPTAGTSGYRDGQKLPTFQCRTNIPLGFASCDVILAGPRTRVKHNTPQVRNDQTTESPCRTESPLLKSRLICVFSRKISGGMKTIHAAGLADHFPSSRVFRQPHSRNTLHHDGGPPSEPPANLPTRNVFWQPPAPERNRPADATFPAPLRSSLTYTCHARLIMGSHLSCMNY